MNQFGLTKEDLILSRPSPLISNNHQPQSLFLSSPVLVVGAGGLGCEILKCLFLSGFQDISILDLDTVSPSNLNRQFLFSEKDIDTPKSTAASRTLNSLSSARPFIRNPVFTPFQGSLTSFPLSFFSRFNLVFAALDSLDSRRSLNTRLAQVSHPVILIDTGSEGLTGHVRPAFLPSGPCLECALSTFVSSPKIPVCTAAGQPRNPEHCVLYALDTVGTDDEEQILSVAQEHAKRWGIEGVDKELVERVIHDAIPAVSSTNALIAACAVEQAKRILSGGIGSSFMFCGCDGAYSFTYQQEKREDCLVCGKKQIRLDVDVTKTTLQDLLSLLESTPNLFV